ncbi:MAG: aminotransferase class V-fold PLP-dependent enzyme, partial [Planctomycetes bacterium]|nr:aminotransferase class V-fold PLP-dependent enzyme [Planctomycetota bacterium]
MPPNPGGHHGNSQRTLIDIRVSLSGVIEVETRTRIYLDYAASTPLDEGVLKVMLPYFTEEYGNPSSLHSFGQQAEAALEQARKTVSKVLNCYPEEVIFTGCGTESDNLALRGMAFTQRKER